MHARDDTVLVSEEAIEKADRAKDDTLTIGHPGQPPTDPVVPVVPVPPPTPVQPKPGESRQPDQTE
jgi:hypothetical protein